MTQREPLRARPDLHTLVSGEEADANCPTEGGFTMATCPHCNMRYAIHCAKCEQQVTNCFLGDTEVISPSGTRNGTRRLFVGEMVTINTSRGNKLTGTPNHPILTTTGWKALGLLEKGDQVLSHVRCKKMLSADPHVNNIPSLISEIYRALVESGITKRISPLNVNFHGERPTSDINVVFSTSLLGDDLAPLGEPSSNRFFSDADLERLVLLVYGSSFQNLLAPSLTSDRGMSVRSHGSNLFGSAISVDDELSFRLSSDWDSSLIKDSTNWSSGHFQLSRNLRNGEPFLVEPDHLVSVHINTCHFPVPVYNLETQSGWYIANGIVAHNCGCTIDRTLERIKNQNIEEEEKRPWLEKRGELWVPPSAR